METLYRKVAVSDRLPKKDGRYFAWVDDPNADNDEDRMFKTLYKDGFGFQSFYNVTNWIEPIESTIKSDNTAVIEKLEADKAELLNHLQDEINEFSVLGYEPSQYQLGYNSAINDIKDICEEISDNSQESEKLAANEENQIYTKEDIEKAYRAGENKQTYYFKDTTVILPTTYEGIDG